MRFLSGTDVGVSLLLFSCVVSSFDFHDSQISVPDGFLIIIILQADVAETRSVRWIDPGRHQFAVDPNRIVLLVAGEFVFVPFAWWYSVRFLRSFKRID